MQIFKEKALLTTYLKTIWDKNCAIGFIPTMGALHQGHLSLIKKSLDENNYNVVSIFVNPTQFNNSQDLEKYPRTLEIDIEKIRTICPDCIVFAPSVDDIYEGKTNSKSFNYDGIEHEMEGKHRPGHFDGVGTIVKKLFEIVKPTNAYFGEKDFQQLQIVKKLVAKNDLKVNIIGCPIFRESNGLAMSSRNERLSIKDRDEASIIYKTLLTAKEKFGTKSANEVNNWVKNSLEKNENITLEYFEIADETTLKTCIRKSKNKKYRAFIAVFIDNIRLIDNISLN
ncbi:pantoate--beta-alanine ligase [Flavobacterium gelidilacus]|uniref:pantoate--beta-alanine ligase n=1 Tax=Flavobacterium gelidilacus TaxID=206041 RepID=UPI00040AFD83|nr:pantoate--beta-alanine ligase [Flavobacterium gelidilacus]